MAGRGVVSPYLIVSNSGGNDVLVYLPNFLDGGVARSIGSGDSEPVAAIASPPATLLQPPADRPPRRCRDPPVPVIGVTLLDSTGRFTASADGPGVTVRPVEAVPVVPPIETG
jgi:hypothetical protein